MNVFPAILLGRVSHHPVVLVAHLEVAHLILLAIARVCFSTPPRDTPLNLGHVDGAEEDNS